MRPAPDEPTEPLPCTCHARRLLTMKSGTILTITLLSAASTSARGQLTPAPIAGISCDRMEGQRLHIHQHLVILDRGKEVPIPANVGQRSLSSCLYWVHTHTPDGIIHIEAPKDRAFTLGDFFQVWGQTLSKTQAASAHAPKG